MTTKHGFYYKEGHNDRLFIDQIQVKQVIDRLSSPPTPFVLYSLNQFCHNVETYKHALKELAPIRARLSYSMKANYNPHLLTILKSEKVMLTTVSGGEMQLALSKGFEVSLRNILKLNLFLFFSHRLLSIMGMAKLMKVFKWLLIPVFYLMLIVYLIWK